MNSHSEIIDLASEGCFYPSGSKYSSGKVKILPINGETEEILANANLAKRGLLDDVFLNAILNGDYDKNELLQCDRESILLNLRILNYGPTANMRMKCGDCDHEYDGSISFGFKSKPFDFRSHPKGTNELSYVFPKCRKTVRFRMPTCIEHEIMLKESWLSMAKAITIDIEGVGHISNFYDYELSATDGKSFRKYFETRTPGFFNEISISCPNCGVVSKQVIDVNTGIFGIRPESKMNIHAEIFDLCYYSNGAFTQDGVYKMPTSLRAFYIKKLIDAKKQEAEANKAASQGKSQTGKIAKPPTVKK